MASPPPPLVPRYAGHHRTKQHIWGISESCQWLSISSCPGLQLLAAWLERGKYRFGMKPVRRHFREELPSIGVHAHTAPAELPVLRTTRNPTAGHRVSPHGRGGMEPIREGCRAHTGPAGPSAPQAMLQLWAAAPLAAVGRQGHGDRVWLSPLFPASAPRFGPSAAVPGHLGAPAARQPCSRASEQWNG